MTSSLRQISEPVLHEPSRRGGTAALRSLGELLDRRAVEQAESTAYTFLRNGEEITLQVTLQGR